MKNSRIRRRAGVAAAALTATFAYGLAAAPAAQADDYVPPLGCGVMFHEVGPITKAVHEGIEPVFRPVRVGPLMLEHQVHGLNCGIVLRVEYLLGLQTQPWVGAR